MNKSFQGLVDIFCFIVRENAFHDFSVYKSTWGEIHVICTYYIYVAARGRSRKTDKDVFE